MCSFIMPKRKASQYVNQEQQKRIKVKQEETQLNDNMSELSSYEQAIQDNIRRNNELLTELNIFQIKNVLKKSKSSKLNIVKSIKMKKEEFPRRQSLRLQKLEPDGVTQVPELPEPSPLSWHKPRHRGDCPMVLVSEGTDEDSKALLSKFDNLLNKTKNSLSLMQLQENSDYSRYKKLMNQMKVEDHHLTKVVPQRVCSLEFHSTNTKTLVFVGDKRGNLGLWDIGSEDDSNVFVYEPHTSPIVAMAMEPHDCHKLFTCSYDGTIRSADFAKATFDEVYVIDEDEMFSYMTFGTTSSSTLLASTGQGQVHVVDYRVGSNKLYYQLHDRKINCLDVHPQEPNIFVTSTQKGIIALWDIRRLKGPSSYLDTISQGRSVSSAFFSPNSGKQILTTGLNDYITVYDVSGDSSFSSYCMYRHCNYTGRWLTNFNARWDPKTTKCFGVGSMNYPRQVDIYSCDYKGGALTHLQHDNFTTITSRIAFHPSRNLIAGANSSGKVFLWTT